MQVPAKIALSMIGASLMLIVAMLVSAATVTLSVVGNPATGAWGVLGTVADTRDVMADMYLDGVYQSTQHTAPYGFPDDVGGVVIMKRFGAGAHVVEFVFKLENSTTEIGRQAITVTEGAPALPGPPGRPTIAMTPASASMLMQWAANTETDLAGYKVYVGTAPKIYGSAVALVTTPTYTVKGLKPGTYYFAVTAYDSAGNESLFSQEVMKVVQ